MTDRERLIFFIMKANSPLISLARAEELADFLLKNGVIVPPCKVGDIVFALWQNPIDKKYIEYCCEVKEISTSKRNCRLTRTYKLEPVSFRGRILEYREDDFYNLVFLTREEAEKHLNSLQRNEGGEVNG